MFNPCQPCCTVTACKCDGPLPSTISIYIAGCSNNIGWGSLPPFFSTFGNNLNIEKFNGTHVLNLVDSNTPPSPADFITSYMHYNLYSDTCLWRTDLGNNYYIMLYLQGTNYGIELTVALCVPVTVNTTETYYVLQWILTILVPVISCTTRYVMDNAGPHIVGPLTIIYGFEWSTALNNAITIIVNNDNPNYHKHLHVGVVANYPIYSALCAHSWLPGSNTFGNNCNMFNDTAIIMSYDSINNDWVYIWPDGIHYVNFYVNGNTLTCSFGKLNTTYQITYSLTLPNPPCVNYPKPHQQDSYDNGATYLLDTLVTNTSDCSEVPTGIFIEPA